MYGQESQAFRDIEDQFQALNKYRSLKRLELEFCNLRLSVFQAGRDLTITPSQENNLIHRLKRVYWRRKDQIKKATLKAA